MAFDPDKYLAENSAPASTGGFDPDAYLASEQEQTFARNKEIVSKAPEKTVGGSFAVGARQGALLGYAPQVEALTEPVVAKLYDVLNGTNMYDELDPYIERRDKAIKKQQQYQDDNPVAYGAGNVVGAVGSLIVPGSVAAKGASATAKGAQAATAGARIARAGKASAIAGALQNPGDTEGEYSGLQIGERGKNAAIAYGTGVLAQGGSEVAGKILGGTKGLTKKAADVIKENLPTLKENAADIIAAARRQNIPVTPSMILKGDKFQALEASLAKSPSLFNRLGKQVQTAREGVEKATEDVLEESSGLSAFEAGQKVKTEIQKKFSDRMAPVSAKFDEVASHTKHMGISEKGVNRVVKNIDKLDEVQLVKGTGLGIEGKARQYSQMLENVKTVDQLKKVGTMLQSEMQAAQGPDRQVLGQMLDKVRRLESRNIERAAIKVSREATGAKPNAKGLYSQTNMDKLAAAESEGTEIAGSLIKDFRSARSDYAGIQGDARELGKQVGVKAKNLREVNQSLDNLTPEEVSKRFFNTGDENLLTYMKTKHPEQFDTLRKTKLSEVLQKSTSTSSGEVLPGTFIRQMNQLTPSVRKMVLGSADKIEKAADVENLYQAMHSYRNFNPSGTGQANALTDMFYSTAKDVPRYALYKGLANGGVRKGLDKVVNAASKIKDVTPSTGKKALGAAKSIMSTKTQYAPNDIFSNPQVIDMISQNPELIDGITDENVKAKLLDKLGRSPQSKPVTKGESAWAAKGLQNLSAHGLADESTMEALLNSPKGQQILNEASSLKPGSKAMDRLIERSEKLKGNK